MSKYLKRAAELLHYDSNPPPARCRLCHENAGCNICVGAVLVVAADLQKLADEVAIEAAQVICTCENSMKLLKRRSK